ncbi:hypothetical protein ACIQTT_15010 [Microbacterium sp. NPDC090225]|uniref:hypothetical protein n=1 Tax=Microbacterium sp. NPDC090225 TaxID=3364207 RepID=UPI00382DF518
MTSTNTLPIPRPTTAPVAHEHSWLTESRHSTSEGIVVYVRCGACAARRVDLRPSSASSAALPPIAMSRSIGESPTLTP